MAGRKLARTPVAEMRPHTDSASAARYQGNARMILAVALVMPAFSAAAEMPTPTRDALAVAYEAFSNAESNAAWDIMRRLTWSSTPPTEANSATADWLLARLISDRASGLMLLESKISHATFHRDSNRVVAVLQVSSRYQHPLHEQSVAAAGRVMAFSIDGGRHWTFSKLNCRSESEAKQFLPTFPGL